jgi:hypothetical protein
MREIYHCQYAILGYHSEEMSRVNMLHEPKLHVCGRSRTNRQYFVSVYRVYSVSIDNILLWVCEL